jgi:hypothetical protein
MLRRRYAGNRRSRKCKFPGPIGTAPASGAVRGATHRRSTALLQINCIIPAHFPGGRQFLKRNAFPITIRSEKPIAAAQRIGLMNPSAASGTPMAL